jgi:large subunit ribosomal protein L6
MTVPELTKEFTIPEDVEVQLDGMTVTATGPKGSLARRFTGRGITLESSNDRIVMQTRFPSTRVVSLFGMQGSLLRNMLLGVTKGFRARLKVINSHFPVTTEVREKELLINNFLGERHPRRARILENVDVGVEGELITVTGPDKDAVAQTAANIEQATVVRRRDRRIFQDGIYLVEKTAPMEE